MSLVAYSIVFAVLVGSTAGELYMLQLTINPTILTITIMGLAAMKAILIALFFQHLKDEQKSLSSLLLIGLAAAGIMITLTLLGISAQHVTPTVFEPVGESP
jgi:drug/metabolite transporter (DMT)-like permease